MKSKIRMIKDKDLYSAEQIITLGVVLDSNLNPSRDRVYKLIKRGILPATNYGDAQPRWFVTGKDLREYVESRYINNPVVGGGLEPVYVKKPKSKTKVVTPTKKLVK